MQIVAIALTATALSISITDPNQNHNKTVFYFLIGAMVLSLITSFVADYTFLKDTKDILMFDIGFKAVGFILMALLAYMAYSKNAFTITGGR